jgi:predicted nicotinamide N-methyase
MPLQSGDAPHTTSTPTTEAPAAAVAFRKTIRFGWRDALRHNDDDDDDDDSDEIGGGRGCKGNDCNGGGGGGDGTRGDDVVISITELMHSGDGIDGRDGEDSSSEDGDDGDDNAVDDGFGLYTWASALRLAAYLFRHCRWLRGRSLLELGAGTGVPSLVAARCGARRVVVTDSDAEPLTLRNCGANVAANGVAEVCVVRSLRWGDVTPLVCAVRRHTASLKVNRKVVMAHGKAADDGDDENDDDDDDNDDDDDDDDDGDVDILLGADVLYDVRHYDALLATVAALRRPLLAAFQCRGDSDGAALLRALLLKWQLTARVFDDDDAPGDVLAGRSATTDLQAMQLSSNSLHSHDGARGGDSGGDGANDDSVRDIVNARRRVEVSIADGGGETCDASFTHVDIHGDERILLMIIQPVDVPRAGLINHTAGAR